MATGLMALFKNADQALRLALAWNRPKQVHLGLADPTIPTFLSTQTLPSS